MESRRTGFWNHSSASTRACCDVVRSALTSSSVASIAVLNRLRIGRGGAPSPSRLTPTMIACSADTERIERWKVYAKLGQPSRPIA